MLFCLGEFPGRLKGGGGDNVTDDENDDEYSGPTPAVGVWAGGIKLESESDWPAEDGGEDGGGFAVVGEEDDDNNVKKDGENSRKSIKGTNLRGDSKSTT